MEPRPGTLQPDDGTVRIKVCAARGSNAAPATPRRFACEREKAIAARGPCAWACARWRPHAPAKAHRAPAKTPAPCPMLVASRRRFGSSTRASS
eukprot:4716781-Prymnesium_polylepis.1